jgi:hypothetical protein
VKRKREGWPERSSRVETVCNDLLWTFVGHDVQRAFYQLLSYMASPTELGTICLINDLRSQTRLWALLKTKSFFRHLQTEKSYRTRQAAQRPGLAPRPQRSIISPPCRRTLPAAKPRLKTCPATVAAWSIRSPVRSSASLPGCRSNGLTTSPSPRRGPRRPNPGAPGAG